MIFTIFSVFVVILLLTQLQSALIAARHGVAGSFGFRPSTHNCIGWVAPADRFAWLPYTTSEFHLGAFHFRYSFTEENFESKTQMCLGQDIWYGE